LKILIILSFQYFQQRVLLDEEKARKIEITIELESTRFFFFGRSELEIEVEGPLAEEGDKNTKIFLRIANLNRRNNTVDS
jgi:hypothetical protein